MSSPAPYSGKGYLRRSMSTRTIRRGSRTPRSSLCSEPFDADDAKHQATVAASLAMRRSAERSSTDSRRSYDSLGGPSSMAVPRRYHRSNYTQDRGDYTPARKPMAREVEPQDNDQISLATLPSINEFGGLDGRNASLPSSYRRLRRSRSMFAPRPRLSHISYGHSHPEDGNQALGSPLSRGTLRRSMSFLRGGASSSHPIRHARSHEAAIQLARSEFEKNSVANDARSRHSSLFTLKPRRDYKPFRKTFRSTSTSGVDPYDTPSSAEGYRSTPAFGRARSFSSSIKRGIKRVLGWNHSKPPCDPAQLQTSPCQSFDQENRSPRSRHYHHGTEIGSEEEPNQLRPRSSFESLATSSSRVTSWADSTVANTITTRRPGEQSHLSIIHERATSGQDLSQPASADYLQRKLPSTPSPSKHSPPIDSQRLYTALMRKIGNPSVRSSEEEIVFGRVKEHRAIPTRMSSVYPRSSRQTIRPVPSDESIISRGSFTTARANIVTPQASRAVFEQKMAEDDTGSVIFATPEGLRASPDTSSVYSRSISGNAPASEEKAADIEVPVPVSEDEPGVATIFEIKRTTYCSPNRTPRSPADMPIRPSVDWQQWMNTQMQRFDKGVLVRDHYREEAQIHGEETDLAHDCQDSSACRIKDQGRSTPAPVDDESLFRMSTNNNFSRPFSRSSSVRTVVVSQKEPEKKAAVPYSTSTSPNYAGPNAFCVSRTRPRSNAISLSPVHPKPGHRFAPPESPTPKRGPAAVHPRLTVKLRYGNQTPGLSPDGRAPSLRSARSYRDITRRTNENVKTEDRPGDYKDLYTQSQQNNSPMSSKPMVELFLDSRRRQMGTEVSDGSVAEDAFV